MPKFKVECDSKHSAADTFTKVKSFLGNDAEIKKLDPGIKMTFDDAQMNGSAKGSKFEADIKVVAKGAGSQVAIEVSLPMLLTPIKGMVQSSIEKKLSSALS